jgi:hypothetical protein
MNCIQKFECCNAVMHLNTTHSAKSLLAITSMHLQAEVSQFHRRRNAIRLGASDIFHCKQAQRNPSAKHRMSNNGLSFTLFERSQTSCAARVKRSSCCQCEPVSGHNLGSLQQHSPADAGIVLVVHQSNGLNKHAFSQFNDNRSIGTAGRHPIPFFFRQ